MNNHDLITSHARLEAENAALRAKVAKLARELTNAIDNNRRRNLQLNALHFVWCSGGCEGGVHRFGGGELTSEIVAAAILNTQRLVSWHINRLYRAHPGYPSSLMNKEDLAEAYDEIGIMNPPDLELWREAVPK